MNLSSMKLERKNPEVYRYDLPMFEGKIITQRVKGGLVNVLEAYVEISKDHAECMNNNSRNYLIKEIYVVGSGARENKIDSDMDLLFIVQNLDENSSKSLKLILSFIFQTDRPKNEAIDVYIRKKDIFPEKESVLITNQVKNLINRCNSRLN